MPQIIIHKITVTINATISLIITTFRPVVVVQLEERSLTSSDDRSLNPVIGNLIKHLLTVDFNIHK